MEDVSKKGTAPSPRPEQAGLSMAGAFNAKALSTLTPFLPAEDLVGGAVPHVAGKEDESVWNAAAQACGTERVHYCYTIDDGRCWYLATPSSALASNPDSWCPLAAALPGNSEYWDRQTVYIYEQEGAAAALRWDQETGRMQVYLGAARTLLPRIQSMEVNFVTINAEIAKPVPWKNLALQREKLSRMMIKILFLSGIVATGVSLLVWVGAYALANSISPKLDEARKVTTAATNQLLANAVNALQSNTDQHLVRVIELLNITSTFGGVLTRYEVKPDNSVEWEALIPNAVQPGQLNAVAVGIEEGRVKVKGTN